MLKPLLQYYCDTCGGIINSPYEGYTEWIIENDYCKDFKIVHHNSYSPRKEKDYSQYLYDKNIKSHSISLDRMTSLGLSRLLSFLNDGSFRRHNTRSHIKQEDLPTFIDFFSRLTIPYYEEARKYFTEASNNLFYRELCGEDIYDQSTLEKIVNAFVKD